MGLLYQILNVLTSAAMNQQATQLNSTDLNFRALGHLALASDESIILTNVLVLLESDKICPLCLIQNNIKPKNCADQCF